MKHTKIKIFVHRINETDVEHMQLAMDTVSGELSNFLNSHKIEAKRIVQNIAGANHDLIITTIQYRDTVGD